MTTITIEDHNFCIISDVSTSIKNLLSYSTKMYNRRTKKWKIDSQSLIDFTSNSTYSGLVSHIQENIPNIQVIDKRVFPEIDLKVPELTKDLREYQIEYLLQALKEKRMIIHATTGSGKTMIMASLLASLESLPALIIAPNVSVMGQLVKELTNLIPWAKFGLVGDGNYQVYKHWVIGLAGSLIKVPVDELRRFKVVLVDECHTSAAQQCHDVILSVNAPYRFGFSGTPTGRSDGKDLVVEGLIGKIVKLIEREELVSQGFIAETQVNFHRAAWDGNYHVLEDLLIVNNPLRNQLIKKIVDKSGARSVLILVRRIDHGKILEKMFGSKSIFLSGEDESEIREEVREDLKRGKYRILIASKIFSAGIDIPSLELGVYAAGGKSIIETIQSAGRVSRPWNEMVKSWTDIYDSYCSVLEEHSKSRLDEYKKEGLPINFIGFPLGMQSRLEKE